MKKFVLILVVLLSACAQDNLSQEQRMERIIQLRSAGLLGRQHSQPEIWLQQSGNKTLNCNNYGGMVSCH